MQALVKLIKRERFTSEDDLVFVGETGCYLDGSGLARRYKQAALRRCRGCGARSISQWLASLTKVTSVFAPSLAIFLASA